MNNLSKTFCPLPWIHLATRPNGDVRVCCTANASGAGSEDEKELEALVKPCMEEAMKAAMGGAN
jgi:hypothetical protein